MAFLDKLERAFGRYAITNLSLYIVIGQVAALFAAMMGALQLENLLFVPAWVLAGEWWRIFTFMFLVPVPGSLLGYVFLAFGWYLFYLMGNALEAHWGAFRYNLYLFVSYALTVVLAFLAPRSAVTNVFIIGSVFLAFARLNPDFELLLFFILPLKIKWLALLTWILNGYLFAVGTLATRLQIGAAVTAFLLFFVGDMMRSAKQGQRVRARQAQREIEAEQPRHVCYVCGKTDKTNPELDFRYCSQCAGDQCYCPDHIRNHAHVVAADDAKAS